MSGENMKDAQNIILENRRKLSVSGVEEVISFDDKLIVLKTTLVLTGSLSEHLKYAI